jgi:predicted AlkP superfamily pyrophosphatase or phosphodiesterase
MPRWRSFAIVVAFALAAAPSAQRAQPPDPILILVSLDGWRWDYSARVPAANLNALASRGVRAERMIPSFPVLTFPNHYTIVTGLYPAHHGIVGNTMNDDAIGERFSMSAETAKDPRWWGGEPLWVTVVKRGGRAATMFWPGTEVAIQGVRPTLWRPYAKPITAPDRVRQVLQWLALPESERPSFVSLYFDEVDTAGHDFGPGSRELTDAARHLDESIGQLVAGIHTLALDARTTLVVVSDHGMTAMSMDRVVYLDDYVDPAAVDITEANGFLAIAPRDGDARALYARLHGKHPALSIYLREQVPAGLHYRGNPRIAPVIGVLKIGWAATTRARLANRPLDPGTHGFDPMDSDMGALFVAAGPDVRHGVVVPPFRNVDVYDILCAVLRMQPLENDGTALTARQVFVPGSASASTKPTPRPRVR